MAAAIVINTSPTLALIAAFDNLDLLTSLYQRVLFSDAVAHEVRQAGAHGFGVNAFELALQRGKPFEIASLRQPLDPWLSAALDDGEASVIALAQQETINLVCIDEMAGRRIARLNSLQVTGSLGILLKLKSAGQIDAIAPRIARMRAQGIWLSADLQAKAMQLAGETA
jgi:predicted nucleic acid-binding protein